MHFRVRLTGLPFTVMPMFPGQAVDKDCSMKPICPTAADKMDLYKEGKKNIYRK